MLFFGVEVGVGCELQYCCVIEYVGEYYGVVVQFLDVCGFVNWFGLYQVVQCFVVVVGVVYGFDQFIEYQFVVLVVVQCYEVVDVLGGDVYDVVDVG